MRDGIELLHLGHPAAVIVQRVFEAAARAQAAALEAPELPIVAIAEPRPGVESSAAEAAALALDAIGAMLGPPAAGD